MLDPLPPYAVKGGRRRCCRRLRCCLRRSRGDSNRSDGIGFSREACYWNQAQCQLGKLSQLWLGGNSAMRERVAQFWLGEFKCCKRRLQRCCSAKAERWRHYLTGSLEHTMPLADRPHKLERCGIREHACEILDGGREAFQKRKDEYRV